MTIFPRLPFLAALALLTVLLAACGQHQFSGTVIDPPKPAKDFTITDASGRPFTLSAQKGNVVALFFGFTNCPDVCPTELADLAAVKRRLGADGERLKVAVISVDPERDTPERMARYVTSFDPSFTGLRADRPQLDALMKDYGVTAILHELPGSALGYTVDHSAFLYIIDKQGNLRMLFSHGSSLDGMTSDLRYLIREGG